MRYPVLVDTNVPISANGKSTHADGACQASCVEKIIDIQANGRVLVDTHGFIFQEYSRHLSHKGQPGLGDFFFKWLWDNQGQASLCTKVLVTPEDADGYVFAVFPNDPALVDFDRSDRKFVATAIASEEQAPIVNATDSDWMYFREALARYGVQVEFLCPHLIKT